MDARSALRALVLVPALAVLAVPAPAGAQEPAAGEPGAAAGVTLYPLVGINWQGKRFRRASMPGTEVSPSSGALLGAGVDVRLSPVVQISALGAFAPVNYERVSGSGRSINGDQTLIRLLGGVQYRVQAHAPGYFSAGGGVTLVRPSDRAYIPEEEDRTEYVGYLGAGLDVGGVRIDGKVLGSFPGGGRIEGAEDRDWTVESFTLDYALFLAYLIEL